MRGSVLKTVLGDKNSPVLYGYDQNALAVYFNQAPVMRVGGGGGFGGGRGGGGPNVPPVGNMQPNAVHAALTTLDGAAGRRAPRWRTRRTRRSRRPGGGGAQRPARAAAG